MEFISSLLIAFSMYSNIPVVQVKWTDSRMKYAMCFFPLIGTLMGVISLAVYRISVFFGAGAIWKTCLLAAVPILVSGGIHIDGYVDTCDARHSFGDREKKLEILKDPHIGAFSVICLAGYMFLTIAAYSEFGLKEVMMLPALYTLERALSGVSVVTFPKAKKDGLASTFSKTASDKAVVVAAAFYAIAAVAYLFYLSIAHACAIVLTAICCFVWYYRMAVREFGGMTGDLAGYFLQITERNCLLVIAVVSFLQGALI